MEGPRALPQGRRLSSAAFALALSIASLCGGGEEPRRADEVETLRLLGKAYYENDDYRAAADQFRRAIELEPDCAADRFNLGLVLMRGKEYEEAMAALEGAEKLDPGLIAVPYIRGIVFKRQYKFEEAVKCLAEAGERDRDCFGAHYNLGMCLKQLRQFEKAIAAFREAERISPQHPNVHYQLLLLYRQVGDVESADRHKEIFERVKDTLDESEKTVEALERSRYSSILGARPGARGARAPGAKVTFRDLTAQAGLSPPVKPPPLPEPLPGRVRRSEYSEADARARYAPRVGGSLSLGDFDGDGDLDIYSVSACAGPEAPTNRLYRNDGGFRFSDVTEKSGAGARGLGMAAAFGDFDNDGRLDLYVANCGPNVLFHNLGGGAFEDVSREARADEPGFGRAAIFLDYDHDDDLDIIVGNGPALGEAPRLDEFSFPGDLPGQGTTLLRNNGNGTFADQTDEAGLLVDLSQVSDVASADFDGDGDADLFVANSNSRSLLFLNARMGKLAPGGSFSPPIEKDVRAAEEADLNGDGNSDLILALGNRLWLYSSDGAARFAGEPIPLPEALAGAGAGRIVLLDQDNDGSLDLLLVEEGGRGVSLLAGQGPGAFSDGTPGSGLDKVEGAVADAAAGDLDGDGDQDIVLQTRDRGLTALRNDVPPGRHWLDVRLSGKKVNRLGYGSTVEVAAPGYYRRQTVRGLPVHFGLAGLGAVDVVRVTWPNGVAQNAIRPSIDGPLDIEEHVKVSASCGFLWADGGKGFRLINEVLGVGPLGVPIRPGFYHQPDSTELTKIEPDQLAARDGLYELRITEDLREVMYADRFTLRVVDHPAGLEVIPNEYFSAPPFPPDRFFAPADPRPPRSAVDGQGRDVLDLVLRRDGRFPTFPLSHYHGLAEPHSLVLDLGDLSGASEILLYLDGWIYWPESSTVMAIAQDPRYEIAPLSLEVSGGDGGWRAAVPSLGLPTSKGLVVPVDLSGKFSSRDFRVRLSTNLCVYFDRIFLSTRDEARRCRASELPVAWADLHYRGFARSERDELGYERFEYDPPSPTGPWSPPRGMLTRYGDVAPLLLRADDMYVIFGPGDELAMRFDARGLPEVPAGWKRSFLLRADGWVKDGDLNTRFSETVEPLPFHGMSGYPYPPEESYPDTPERRRYRETWNVRPWRSTVGPLAPALR